MAHNHYGMGKPSRPKSSAKLVMGEASGKQINRNIKDSGDGVLGKQKPKRSSKMKY